MSIRPPRRAPCPPRRSPALPLIGRCAMMALLIVSAMACFQGPSRTSLAGPYPAGPHEIPGIIEAEHFDRGLPGEAYHDLEVENRGGSFRTDTEVDVEVWPTASNGHRIGWTRPGEWLTYTVHVRERGSYSVEFLVASAGPGGTFHLKAGGVDLTGPIQIPDTGGWDRAAFVRHRGIHLEAGVQRLKLVMDSRGVSPGIADFDFLRFERAAMVAEGESPTRPEAR